MELRVLANAIMASFTARKRSTLARSAKSAAYQSGVGLKVSTKTQKTVSSSDATSMPPGTVFDLLYNSYLPFRLYADYMLGSSTAELARTFALSEEWVTERIEAVRLCGKQVRVNLFDSAPQPDSAC